MVGCRLVFGNVTCSADKFIVLSYMGNVMCPAHEFIDLFNTGNMMCSFR